MQSRFEYATLELFMPKSWGIYLYISSKRSEEHEALLRLPLKLLSFNFPGKKIGEKVSFFQVFIQIYSGSQ